ncbi:MAG: histone deacetylase [Thermoanaerobaculia bacterium]|nr:histone deacetylase [Thermoanaerobaculia bacterium]
MRIFSSDAYPLPLPPGHRFPMAKYARLRRAVEEEGLAPAGLAVPGAATDEELLRVHTRDWVERVTTGRLTPDELRRLGFPWSRELVERSRRSVGGTLGACRSALASCGGVNLAGGTHHAFADRGEGYCVFNDAAVAVAALRAEGRIERAVILDCDVHQGDGTATIFAGDPSVFTLSVHGRRNYPFRKARSDLDVALDDGAGDGEYLAALDGALDRVPLAGCGLAVYLAGADPYAGDRLGRLALTPAGLAERDRRVLTRCREAGVPVAVAMAGGYAERIDEVVEIHLATVRAAVNLLDSGRISAAGGSAGASS